MNISDFSRAKIIKRKMRMRIRRVDDEEEDINGEEEEQGEKERKKEGRKKRKMKKQKKLRK